MLIRCPGRERIEKRPKDILNRLASGEFRLSEKTENRVSGAHKSRLLSGALLSLLPICEGLNHFVKNILNKPFRPFEVCCSVAVCPGRPKVHSRTAPRDGVNWWFFCCPTSTPTEMANGQRNAHSFLPVARTGWVL